MNDLHIIHTRLHGIRCVVGIKPYIDRQSSPVQKSVPRFYLFYRFASSPDQTNSPQLAHASFLHPYKDKSAIRRLPHTQAHGHTRLLGAAQIDR